MHFNWIHFLIEFGVAYLFLVIRRKVFHAGFVTNTSLHFLEDTPGTKTVYSADCPHGAMFVKIRPIQKGKYLNGLASVQVGKYGGKVYWLPKPRVATLFREIARKHWWQFWRYRHAEDVAVEMRQWVEEAAARIVREEEEWKAREGAMADVQRQALEAARRLNSDSHGALSDPEANGGAVSVADCAKDPNDLMYPLYNEHDTRPQERVMRLEELAADLKKDWKK